MTGGRLLCVASVAAAAVAPAGADRGGTPPRIVAVAVSSATGAAEVATGFVAGGDRVVTVAHVLDGDGTLTVDGRPAAVVRVDRRGDLAVLAVRGLRAAPIRIASGTGAVGLLVHGAARPARVRPRWMREGAGGDVSAGQLARGRRWRAATVRAPR